MAFHRDRRATLPWAKIDPPRRGRPQEAIGCVATLARTTSPRFALLLSTGFLRTIMLPQYSLERPYRPFPI